MQKEFSKYDETEIKSAYISKDDLAESYVEMIDSLKVGLLALMIFGLVILATWII